MISPDSPQPQQNQFGWLVNDFAERVPGSPTRWSCRRTACC